MDHFATVFNIYVANWANPKFSNGYNSVILKAIIMKFLPRIQNCGPSIKMPMKYMLISLKLQHGITVYYKYKLHLQISLLNFGCDITRTKSVHTLQKIKKLSFLTSTLDYFLMAIISSSSPVGII